ncbi:MAG TPA: PTS IIA-like nitrogen regulatory protein PtsN [Stellaceae bacterium]|nr:PTS IIA-like nitrogen regulatory protein PtsN [Stellaceae bacterium]
MEIAELITPQAVVPSLRAAGKRQLLQELAKRAAALAGLDEKTVLEALVERERLGSTGIGGGTAVPHARLSGIARMFALFARLDRPIPFESVDDQPVDLVFLLLAPESAGADHLKALARISRLLRDQAVCAKLRGTDSADALYALLTDRTASHAA